MLNEPLLDVRQLCVDYFSDGGTVHAVTDVSFLLHRGEILGIAGESGSGKSTLVYAITRLLSPLAQVTGGEVLYHPPTDESANGSSTTGSPVDILRLLPGQMRALRWSELAIVFQSAMNSLNPVMTIGTQIVDVLRAHRPDLHAAQRRERATELLRLVGITPDRLGSYPHELSGGMRQRAAIAIALALAPKIIIMDEPTTALDVVVQREILMEIIALRQELNLSIIFITHDLSLLLEIADTIAIMYAGRIVEQGTQLDLFQHPRHPYSYGLLNAFPTLTGEQHPMYGIPGSPPDLRDPPAGCAFHPRCPLAFTPCAAILPELRAALDSTQQVACHLYDARFHDVPPSTHEIAAGYASLAEGRHA
jgi:peptide/nickel transport system ATP-binding protein